ncbi:response regulator transcription factor [Nonomuraea angiospora]|uniref:response regulator transcription factor n=1 Tax=Nonomuraea angiospora TaxID=46172 RepID=UPI0029B017B4|nr:response regulator transcription factor [Nonomuraea angiospora]MDX3111504.1 response regulator transcription factor [Nonomuraea angiospora]
MNDNLLARSGLRSILSQQPDLQVVGEADNLAQAGRIFVQARVDLFVVDSPSVTLHTLDAVRFMTGRPSRAPVLIVTADPAGLELDLLRLGCYTLPQRQLTATELIAAVRLVIAGYAIMDRRNAGYLASAFTSRHDDVEAHTAQALTRREQEITGLIAQGLSNTDIADILGIAHSTVKGHVKEIFRKLGLRNRVQAALYHHAHTSGEPTSPHTRT